MPPAGFRHHRRAQRRFYVSAGSGNGLRVALSGSAWFDPDALDILKLEVRVEKTPPSVRVAGTTETTTYTHAKIGDVEFVLPASSDLLLRDRNGTEARNHSTFDRYRRYSGSATIFYGPADTPVPAASPRAALPPQTKNVTATLDEEISADAAIRRRSHPAHHSRRRPSNRANCRHAPRTQVVDGGPDTSRDAPAEPAPAGAERRDPGVSPMIAQAMIAQPMIARLLFIAASLLPTVGSQALKFEVASVKPDNSAGGRGVPVMDAQRLAWHGATLKHMICEAYKVQYAQVSGAPSWTDTERYDVEARAEKPSTRDQLRQMLRSLLSGIGSGWYHAGPTETFAGLWSHRGEGRRGS